MENVLQAFLGTASGDDDVAPRILCHRRYCSGERGGRKQSQLD